MLAASVFAAENGSATVYAQQGDALFHQGEYKKSAQMWEKAVKLDSTNADYRDGLGRAYERQSESSSFSIFLTTKARNSFIRALQLQPHHAAAMADLIELEQQPVGLCQGDLREASTAIERLAKVDPDAAERAREYWDDAKKDAQRPGEKALCGPVKLTRMFTRPFSAPPLGPSESAQTQQGDVMAKNQHSNAGLNQ